MTILRFLVALGTGGEWSVGAALVAEVFSKRARAWSLGIFHGSSTLGTYVAVIAGVYIVGNPNLGWRWGFVLGALPALLTLWVAWSLREPERWIAARDTARKDATQQTGRVADLFAPALLRNTLVGLCLATVGLATFWGTYVYGKDLLLQAAERYYLKDTPPAASPQERQAQLKALPADARRSIKNWEMLGMFLVTTGGGIGLLSFGPICERIGRRRTFLWFHLGGLAAGLILYMGLATAPKLALCLTLPVFGFLTLAIHAGYAIYFPELFPTRLRGTGGGFCFNGGRFLAASILLVRAWMRSSGEIGRGPVRVQGLGLSFEHTATILSLLFLLGLIVLLFAPETKGKDLPT